MKLSIGYSDSEDRVWLRIEGSTEIWWLTRRLALRLLAKWAELVERSYAQEGKDVPSAGAASTGADRAEAAARVRSAHTRALGSAARVGPMGRPAPGVEMANRIVSSIDLTTIGAQKFRLALKGGGAQGAIGLSREEAHRMLDALHARCARSGWFAYGLPDWLGAEAPSRIPAKDEPAAGADGAA